MFLKFYADKDTYITNRVIKNVRQYKSNVGDASSLDLYKLYGISSSGSLPNTELTRLLIHFDIDNLRTLYSQNKIDISHPSFKCYMNLYDVYGGQPTPKNFTVQVYPLSASFDEGIGKDVVYYSDYDVANWLTASIDGVWFTSGCGLGGLHNQTVDYITSINGDSTQSTQLFRDGTENLYIDVTTAISATLAGIIPDNGFRVNFADSIESNNKTYFVKRFAARNAYNVNKHPSLSVKFDDSINDDSLNLLLDQESTIFMYNYNNNDLNNLQSGSTEILGSNCLLLKLETNSNLVSSSNPYVLYFTGSQHSVGLCDYEGIYSASFTISSNDPVIKNKLTLSGNIKFTPVWCSFDKTVAYMTGSKLTFNERSTYTYIKTNSGYSVNVYNINSEIREDEVITARVHIYDKHHYLTATSKLPVELPGMVLKNVYYSVRNVDDNTVVIPFDSDHNSTRLSADTNGMYFNFNASTLPKNNRYVIDIKIINSNNTQLYEASSGVFRVVSSI